MAMSDGVHDNLHPASLDITPQDLKIADLDSWENSQVKGLEEAASRFRVQYFKKLLGNKEYTPHNILTTAIHHSETTTSQSRDFMETKPGKRLPKDYGLYPGKMDHSTCVAFRVGSQGDKAAPSPLLVLLVI